MELRTHSNVCLFVTSLLYGLPFMTMSSSRKVLSNCGTRMPFTQSSSSWLWQTKKSYVYPVLSDYIKVALRVSLSKGKLDEQAENIDTILKKVDTMQNEECKLDDIFLKSLKYDTGTILPQIWNKSD
jgi:hypothetical protein